MEEWDDLMLKEYQGINPVAVGLALLTVLMGCILYMNYLTSSFLNQVDSILSQFKEEEEQNEDGL